MPQPSELLLRLYREMLRIRVVEEQIAARYSEQEMRCPVHLSVGQEAVAAGVSVALAPRDYAMSTHRAHAHYLAKGGSLGAMLGELYGRVTGCCQGKGGSMHLIDVAAGFLGAVPIVGSTLPIAVGAAFGCKLKGEDRVTVAYFGEGATEEGVFHEAVNYAALHKLAVVFVCENNFFSVYSPLSVRQPEGRGVTDLARGHGIEAWSDDGNDAVAVYQRTKTAVDKARAGGGPTFLEFVTYRWREHCGPNFDNDIGYRAPTEYEEWKTKDPLPRLAARLLKEGVCSQADLDQMTRAMESEADGAFAVAKSSPFPGEDKLWEHLHP
jgi:TPP-dependent pyruvate/acetoin dehydrogenase alpha subunit